MEAEKVVGQPFGDQIEKYDLTLDWYAETWLFELVERYPRPFRQCGDVRQQRGGTSISSPRYSAGRRRYVADLIGIVICLHSVVSFLAG